MDNQVTNTMRKESGSASLKQNKLMLKLMTLKNSLKSCYGGGRQHICSKGFTSGKALGGHNIKDIAKNGSLSKSQPRNIIHRVYGHMKTLAKLSLSCAISSSSQESCHDDADAEGKVFVWGEGTKNDGSPRALESSVLLDIQNIACGGRHAALVTKQGKVFSWGEDSDVLDPKPIDANIKLVACDEYHTCAVTHSGDLYTWGSDGTTHLGHGNDQVCRWVPKRVNGPLESIHVSSISCGPWHTDVITSAGQLFTFGDGTFSVLGHGDRNSVSLPREVESLKGLRTVRVACGVWHSATIVEVVLGSSSSNKLFTWGDGDKGQFGHGDDKETKLVPTCVAALIESNFCRVACGHSLTVALTTTGHVYTMRSPVYGQLGNRKANGKAPTRVEGPLYQIFIDCS